MKHLVIRDDNRAKKILLDMHWSSSGWKVPADTPDILDFEYAKSAGFLFDDTELSHRKAVSRIHKSVKGSNVKKLADLYVASLSKRTLHIRPGLPAYFEAAKFERHWFSPDKNQICSVCKLFKSNKTSFNSWNFARYKWGSFSRHYSPLSNSFILEMLVNEKEQEPNTDDWGILKELIQILSENTPERKASDVIKLWKNVIPSNKQEREVLFESFISMGIVTPSRVTQQDYERIPLKSAWSDEAALWRGDDLPNKSQISNLFGENAIT